MRLPKILLGSATALCATASALAQAVPPPGGLGVSGAAPAIQLQPVRVTADLWESPLDAIPASVSVYDDRALASRAVAHFGDLADQIPNLTWSGGTSRPRYFQIRGIGENSHYEGETPDSAVRFLVDDLDFTGLGSLASTFDGRQVEVLRGPQAGAFGANAAGGVVRIVTNAPTPFWTGQVEGTVGDDGLRSGGFATGGPLLARTPERLMMRLAVQRHVSDGFRRNVTLNRDTNARDEWSARLRLTSVLSPVWRWEGTFLHAELDNGYDDFALDNNGERTFSDQPGRDEQRSTGAALRGTFTGWTSARLTSVTNGTWTDSVYSYDDDWTAASYQGFSDLWRERDVFNQELRVDSVATRGALGWIDRWTVGAFYSDVSEDSAYTNEDPGNLRGLRTTYRGENTAVFGQVAHDLSGATRLTLGLRGEHVDLSGSGLRTRYRKSRGTYDPTARFSPAFDDTMLGGKLTVEHQLSPRHLMYVSVARGYKGGGVNIDARINPPADPLTYDTEVLWNYEAGLRGSWLEQRLVGEVSAFYLQRRQTQVRDSAGFGGSYRFFTANAEDAKVYGFEASTTFAFTREWSLNATLARMESSLDPFQLTNGNTAGGQRLANTPRHGYSIGTQYRAATGWFGLVELVGRSRQFDSNNHDEARSAFNVVNASVGYTTGPWRFTLWARNLLDESYEKRVFFFGNADPDYVPTRYESRADPRHVGVTAAYRF